MFSLRNMESDGTPDGEPPLQSEKNSRGKRKRKSKTRRRKKHARRSRESTTSSSSSSTVSDSSDSLTLSRPKKRKAMEAWSTKEVLKFLNLCKKKNSTKRSLSSSHHHNVIPEFNPSSKSQTISSWLKKVNECAVIYDWDEKQTIHFALQKLVGLAKQWFESLPSVVFSWEKWQSKLKKAFPNEQNYGQLLEEMLSRTTRSNENLREYFYDKLTLLNRCEIKGKKAVDCIVHGIFDKSIRNSAQALDCKEPEDLLGFLSSQHMSSERFGMLRKRTDGALQSRPSSLASTSNDNGITCYNCRAKGHPYFKCPKPQIKCAKCQRVGHNNEDCKLEPLVSRKDSVLPNRDERKILTISTANDNNNKFHKQTQVNDHKFIAYIDFGSECSLMRQSDAQRLNLTRNYSKLPVVKGFGNSAVTPIYRSTIDLKLDDIEATIEILVVNDEFLHTPLLIGQNFTELSYVTVFKDCNTLFFYNSPNLETHTDSLKLIVPNVTTVPKSGLVEVITADCSFSGDIYVEGYSSNQPGKEYHLPQGAYRVNSGKCHINVTNLSGNVLSLPANTLIARAMPFVERQVLTNNKIIQDPSTLEPLEKSDIKAGPEVDSNTFQKLYTLLQSYRDCFALNLSEIGCTDSGEMKISLLDDKPVVYRPYRLPYTERQQVKEIVDDLLRNDIIQHSKSNYASPILIVKKKTGEQRLCVDYRALNNKTQKDRFPMPLIDDQLTNLSGNKYFTSLDLASGYYQVPVAEESRPLTAFVTPDGHFEFKRMPFGLANAPAVFQRVINNMLESKRNETAMAYLDDILVPSSNLEQGFDRLEGILKLLRKTGLTLKLSKCRFFDNCINYLGYEISADGIRPNENKILAVKEFPIPRNVHEVRQFLGLASYFRKFIKGFGEIARPLTNLLRKNIIFKWTEVELKAFSSLKDHLIARPILALYNPNLDTELHTDASALGVGGILMQWQNQSPRVLKPVAYFSRQTAPEERHLHSYELETLAIVCSLKKFRVYLLGLQFKLVTDCQALRTTLTKRDLVPRIARWWLQISEFSFTIEYRPGLRMAHVDALSRNTTLPSETSDNSSAVVYNIETDDNWLLTLQLTDPDISRIVKILKPETDEEARDIRKSYVIKNHRVYRKVGDDHCLVVPRGARWQICRANHDDVGHLGIAKTTERIQKLFWFPKLRRFVQKYVKSCIQCAYNNDNASRHKTGLLHPIEKVPIPFHTIHIDHLGPFVKSTKGNNYILTVVDGFTKYVFIRSVRDTKTKTTLKALQSIFYDFGLPHRIISDRGTSFTSATFKSFCINHGIKHVLNAVACPRANGQAERYNQTILNALAKHNDSNNERNWDMFIGKIQWGINNAVNSSTQKTPTEAMFGVRLRDSLSNKIDMSTDNTPETLENVRNEISNNIKASQIKQKQNYDAGRAPAPVYKVGDLVKITRTNFNNKGKSTKLMSKFIGPFKITELLGNDRYKITDIKGFTNRNKKFESVVASERIRPWINVAPPMNPNQSPYNSSSSSSTSSSSDENDLIEEVTPQVSGPK